MIATSQTAPIAQISLPPDAPRLALNYCRLGATDAQLAEFCDVSPATLGRWLADSSEFAAAVRRGRKMADVEVADSLHRLATGYVETIEKVMVCRNGPMVVTYRKQHRPHYKAGMTWLCNRMPEDWKWPGARRNRDEVAAEAVDFFSLPLLVEDSIGVADEEDEALPVAAHAESAECSVHPVVPTGAPLDFARDKLSAARRDLPSTGSGLSRREGPSAPLRGACPERSREGRDDGARSGSAPQRVLVAA